MATHQSFPHFAALPEGVRDHIWQRAAQDVVALPSVRLVALSRHRSNAAYEDTLVHEAVRAVSRAAAADPSNDWDEETLVQEKRKAATAAVRRHRATLVMAKRDTRLTMSASWRLADIAGACTGAFGTVMALLRALNKEGAATLFDPTKDVVCLELSMRYKGDPDWHFDSFFAHESPPGTRVPIRWEQGNSSVRQVVEVEASGNIHNGVDSSPALEDICPDSAAFQRVAFVYQKQGPPTVAHVFRPYIRGVHALWPFQMPSLKEIYFVDETIGLRDGVEQQQLLASAPSFAGSLGTFYEVPVHSDLWDTKNVQRRGLDAFDCAAWLTQLYKSRGNAISMPCPISVKVLAFIPHGSRG